jgi:tRNA pseudouridine38-40 synthase
LDQTPPTRFKLLIAYDGGHFLGWQSQAGGNTVQDVLESAFFKLCGTRIVPHGSGRTDTGVHAHGQVAHVDIPHPRLQNWAAALNAHLPKAIRVMECSPVPSTFHARFDAKGKIYTYRIYNGPVQDPFEVGRSWHLQEALDFPMLTRCAAKLVGTHDFGGFAANRGKPGEDTVRTISRIVAERHDPIITLTFEGTGFLYKMVRLLAGSMVRCAQHKAEPEWLDELLARQKKSSFAAYAHGLYLSKVLY